MRFGLQVALLATLLVCGWTARAQVIEKRDEFFGNSTSARHIWTPDHRLPKAGSALARALKLARRSFIVADMSHQRTQLSVYYLQPSSPSKGQTSHSPRVAAIHSTPEGHGEMPWNAVCTLDRMPGGISTDMLNLALMEGGADKVMETRALLAALYSDCKSQLMKSLRGNTQRKVDWGILDGLRPSDSEGQTLRAMVETWFNNVDIFFEGTGGMREASLLLEKEHRGSLEDNLWMYLRDADQLLRHTRQEGSHFSSRVVAGAWQGNYQFLAATQTGKNGSDRFDRETTWLLALGGYSTQIATSEVSKSLFGAGYNRLLTAVVNLAALRHQALDREADADWYEVPLACLSRGASLSSQSLFNPRHNCAAVCFEQPRFEHEPCVWLSLNMEAVASATQDATRWVGTGDFSQCKSLLREAMSGKDDHLRTPKTFNAQFVALKQGAFNAKARKVVKNVVINNPTLVAAFAVWEAQYVAPDARGAGVRYDDLHKFTHWLTTVNAKDLSAGDWGLPLLGAYLEIAAESLELSQLNAARFHFDDFLWTNGAEELLGRLAFRGDEVARRIYHKQTFVL